MLGLRGLLLASLMALISGVVATAQEFPTKAVELVLPYAAGGSHDLTARAVASVAHEYLGQPLLVVLKPGGGGAVGSQQVIRAKPDGYTLAFGGTGPNTVFAMVQKVPIGPDQFTPVARINHSPTIFAVRAEAPWKSFREVIEYAKKNPGKFNFANTGPWGAADLPMRLIGRAAGDRVQQYSARRRRTGNARCARWPRRRYIWFLSAAFAAGGGREDARLGDHRHQATPGSSQRSDGERRGVRRGLHDVALRARAQGNFSAYPGQARSDL